ncbi:MAG: DUF2859 domain-containing protein [Pseudomonadota bacterium]
MRKLVALLPALGFICALALLSRAACAAEPTIRLAAKALTVVAVRAGSVSSYPYLRKLHETGQENGKGRAGQGKGQGNGQGNGQESRARLRLPAQATVPPDAIFKTTWPVTPSVLRVGAPTVKRFEGLVTPVFVIGLDRTSLRWFEGSAAKLARLGAQGVVIQAANQRQWQAFRSEARTVGLAVHLVDDSAIADGYGVSTYPVLLADPSAIKGSMRASAR